ncbi:leucine-rich repeat domain-containing protein, partial [Flavobacterium sp.]|uniref:leucine-rich repeat domain-containing protein n=1 Tax=Flavobacterium sp. TaxID=239 RepID=UPI0038D3BD4B
MKKIYFLLISLCLFTSVNAQIINFPDANFKAKLLEASPSNNISQNLSVVNFKIDANNNGEIEVSEAEQVSALQIPYSSIISLDGISNFSNLTYLDCSQNQLSTLNLSNNSLLTDLQCYYNQLTSLNVSGNTSLENLNCYNNQLIYLSVSNNSLLKYLQCLNNQLTNLDLSNNTALIFLSCDQNQLYGLNLTNNTSLITLYCRNNQLTSLNLGNNTIVNTVKCDFNQLTSLNVNNNISLLELNCSNNQLTNLDFSNNRYLYALECSSNQLTSLDLSNNKELSFLNCNFNQLNNLFIKNGLNEIWQDSNGNFTSVFLFENNLNLQYICADENQISQIQNQISVYGYTNCHVNSYCSFTPGGTFYTFQGNNKYDSNNNSCDALDLPLSNLKFNITDGTNSVSLISNTSGSYSIPVQAGTHTITPVFENPSYFAVSPTTVNVTFPTQTSPFTQNFCITANGVHPDLEVTLLPLEIARPGFDATYKIIYKNKGNTTQS